MFLIFYKEPLLHFLFRILCLELSEIKQLREQKWDLDYVETYVLQKDFEMEKEIRKKKELIEKSKTVLVPYFD